MDPMHGGPPEAIRQMSRTLGKEGHSSEVACLDRAGRLPNERFRPEDPCARTGRWKVPLFSILYSLAPRECQSV